MQVMPHAWPSSCPLLTIEPAADERACPHCARRMRICDHRFRRIETRSGPRRVCCKLLKCPDRACLSAGTTFSPQAEQQLAPPKLAIDWDLFAWIGHRRFARHWSVPTICAELADAYQIVFSRDAIEQYIHRYERMVAARHQDPAQLADAYANLADVVLSIDGLQPEKGHEVLYVVRELNAGRVWFAAPLLSSTAPEIEALLRRAREIAEALGKPVRAWVSDKQNAFVTGIAKVFPQVPHRLCKIHFVRALAKETRAQDGRVKVEMRKKVRGLRTIEREVLAATRTPSVGRAEVAPGPTVVSTATADEPLGVEVQAVAAQEAPRAPGVVPAEPAAPEPVGGPSATPPWADLVLDYSAATRGILNEDQGRTLDPPGLRMARALEEVKVSLDVCLGAKKGGPPKAC